MRRLLLTALLSLAVVALPACGGDDPDTAPTGTVPAGDKLTLTGGDTTLTLDGITAGVLTGGGVSVAPVEPATQRAGRVVIPIIGGELTTGTLAGAIEHEGGVAFTAGKKRITYTDLRIDTVAQQVYAGSGDETPVLDLDLRGVKRSNEGGDIVVSGVVVTLAADAAEELNEGLDVSAFAPAQVIGKVTIRAAGS